MKKLIKLIALLLVLIFALNSCFAPPPEDDTDTDSGTGTEGGSGGGSGDGDGGSGGGSGEGDGGSYLPAPTEPYELRNGNVPYFTEDEITASAYEYYSALDSLGRCGVVHASIGIETMPPKGDKRGEIGHVYPTGWEQERYDTDLVEGGYIYNRSHLIGWQLTDEDDNERNLITGTRYFNVEGMLPFENQVADYVKETGNHVMYRVTPDFKDDNLVASGVLMEAWSVEDDGDGICFCVYVYNYQPGITINYKTGENMIGETVMPPVSDTEGDTGTSPDTPSTPSDPSVPDTPTEGGATYVLNTNTMKFHDPDCSSASKISESNKQTYTGSREDLINEGYTPCSICDP